MFVLYISRQLLLSVPDVQRHDACRNNLRITAVHPVQPAACVMYTEVKVDGGTFLTVWRAKESVEPCMRRWRRRGRRGAVGV